jgi:hypothetical protein
LYSCLCIAKFPRFGLGVDLEKADRTANKKTYFYCLILKSVLKNNNTSSCWQVAKAEYKRVKTKQCFGIIAANKIFNSAGSSVSDQINLSDEEKPLTAAVQNQPKWSGRGGQALGNPPPPPPPSPHPQRK